MSETKEKAKALFNKLVDAGEAMRKAFEEEDSEEMMRQYAKLNDVIPLYIEYTNAYQDEKLKEAEKLLAEYRETGDEDKLNESAEIRKFVKAVKLRLSGAGLMVWMLGFDTALFDEDVATMKEEKEEDDGFEFLDGINWKGE